MFMLKKKKTPAEETEHGFVTIDEPASGNTAEENPTGAPASTDTSDDKADNDPDADMDGRSTEHFDETKISEAFEAWLTATVTDPAAIETVRPALEILLNALTNGCCDEALFELLAKGLDYERAITEAESAGEIKGRNARIDELIATGPDDDGVPHPGVSSGPLRKNAPSIFDIARTAF